MSNDVRVVLGDQVRAGFAYLGVRDGYQVTREDVFRVWTPHVKACLSEGRCPHHFRDRVTAESPNGVHPPGGDGWLWCVECGGAWRVDPTDPNDFEWLWTSVLNPDPTRYAGTAEYFRGGPYITLEVVDA